MQTVMVYTYQCDLMGWPREKGPTVMTTIGYNMGGEFENHPLTGTMQSQMIGCLSQRSDDSIGRLASKWHNQLYQLPTAVGPVQQRRSECLTMKILDIQSVGDIRSLSSSLGTCPNSLSQASLDYRFTLHNQLSTPTSQCYVHIFLAGDANISSLICCYSIQLRNVFVPTDTCIFSSCLYVGQIPMVLCLWEDHRGVQWLCTTLFTFQMNSLDTN